ncbi:MAG: DUF1330 domain-containing protein [Pseudomonadota bacterium]
MPAYLLVRCRIHDYASFQAYSTRTAELVAQFGGTYRVLGGEPEKLEGDLGEGAWVISEWPSKEAALKFWHSPEYVEAKALRADNSDADIMLLQGVS